MEQKKRWKSIQGGRAVSLSHMLHSHKRIVNLSILLKLFINFRINNKHLYLNPKSVHSCLLLTQLYKYLFCVGITLSSYVFYVYIYTQYVHSA